MLTESDKFYIQSNLSLTVDELSKATKKKPDEIIEFVKNLKKRNPVFSKNGITIMTNEASLRIEEDTKLINKPKSKNKKDGVFKPRG